MKPTTRSVNMLFGILMFVIVILLLAGQVISRSLSEVRIEDSTIYITESALILIGLLFITIFYIMSIAFCNKTKP
jgi:hypothetical protein